MTRSLLWDGHDGDAGDEGREALGLVHGIVRIMGKGNRKRMTPIGKTALHVLESYLGAVRPYLLRDPAEPALFVAWGKRLPYHSVLRVVHQYADKLGFKMAVTPHTFRRSYTTELIRDGYGYDDAGRRTAETNTYGQVTRFGYWPSGSLRAMTNALGTNYWLYSDAAGACSSCGNSGSVTDSLGRVTESITSAHGLPLQAIRRASAGATGENAATNTTLYLTGMTTPEQEAEEYPAAITDEGGRTRQYGYTARGQLYRATDLSGSTWWTNQFDLNTGALTNLISPTGETNAYTFDELENVNTIRFSDGNWLTNFYNAQNRLSGVRLPSGALLTNLYDFAGRLTNRQARVNGVVTEAAAFEYNASDAVTRMTDNTGSTTNLYDAAGRLWGIDYPSGASVRYELDLLGRITGVTNKASSGGTAYVTKYQYDPVGNVTNITDPFNGKTSFEYDRVGRRSKRTLPNGIVTTWQYNWKDQVTNIVHKTGGGTVLASVLYERAAGGEPTKITREDGSYVALLCDSALRLTNEIYYTNGIAQITNSYGYDASGSRIRLAKGGATLTNAVSAGYRITEVKQDGSTVESYGYDPGGRVTTILRDNKTWNLGYNAIDQVTATTNSTDGAWVTYGHDANGRRTVSTNSAGTVRRLLVAPTPGSDLESPHLIANASGMVQEGYVYLGYGPLLRYGTGGTTGYYLEDAMGSVVGLAPVANPSAYNTTRLFYDGFGNARGTNGPAPTIPTGTEGDFRFHGCWLEVNSGLYNMRAREYDASLGRFTSRDPDEGAIEDPESLHPYNFANSNSYVNSDRNGETTMVEINVVGFLQFALQTLRGAAINEIKYAAIDRLTDAFYRVLFDQISELWPGFNFQKVREYLKNVPGGFGSVFDIAVQKAICEAVKLVGGDALGDQIHYNVQVVNKGRRVGDPVSSGSNCNGKNPPVLGQRFGARVSKPDFIFGPTPLIPPGGRTGVQRTYFVAEAKGSASMMYNEYVLPGRKRPQLNAILAYSGKHTETHMAFFIIAKNDFKRGLANKGRYYVMRRVIGAKALRRGVIPLLVKVL